MTKNLIYVCSECGTELVREDGDEEGLTLWICPTHGQRGFFYYAGEVDLDELRGE